MRPPLEKETSFRKRFFFWFFLFYVNLWECFLGEITLVCPKTKHLIWVGTNKKNIKKTRWFLSPKTSWLKVSIVQSGSILFPPKSWVFSVITCWPIPSMWLVYLPTCTIKTNQMWVNIPVPWMVWVRNLFKGCLHFIPRSQHCEVATPKQSFQWCYYSFPVLQWLNFQVIYTYTLEINMEPKVMEVWKMIFPFNWVIFRFQPLVFRGVYISILTKINMSGWQYPIWAFHPLQNCLLHTSGRQHGFFLVELKDGSKFQHIMPPFHK